MNLRNFNKQAKQNWIKRPFIKKPRNRKYLFILNKALNLQIK